MLYKIFVCGSLFATFCIMAIFFYGQSTDCKFKILNMFAPSTITPMSCQGGAYLIALSSCQRNLFKIWQSTSNIFARVIIFITGTEGAILAPFFQHLLLVWKPRCNLGPNNGPNFFLKIIILVCKTIMSKNCI